MSMDSVPGPLLMQRTAALRTRRILVIDDNADWANMLAAMLRMMNQDVRTAYDSRTAMLICQRFLPELVFLDLVMPRMDGLETAQSLKQTVGLNAVIIGMTGQGAAAQRAMQASESFDACYAKPLALGEVLRILETGLRVPGSSDEVY